MAVSDSRLGYCYSQILVASDGTFNIIDYIEMIRRAEES